MITRRHAFQLGKAWDVRPPVVSPGGHDQSARLHPGTVLENDDALLEAYFEGEMPSDEQLVAGLRSGILGGTIFPVLCGSATGLIGIDRLADDLVASDAAPFGRPVEPFDVGSSQLRQEIGQSPEVGARVGHPGGEDEGTAGELLPRGAEVELVGMVGREFRLRDALLDDVLDGYEYVLVDCPPSLGLLTLNALAAADSGLLATTGEPASLPVTIDGSRGIPPRKGTPRRSAYARPPPAPHPPRPALLVVVRPRHPPAVRRDRRSGARRHHRRRAETAP